MSIKDTVDAHTVMPESTLVVEIDSLPPQILDCQFEYVGTIIDSMLYERLIDWEHETSKSQLSIANQIVPTNRGQTWTIELNPDLMWSTGLPLTAHDIASRISELGSSASKNPLSWLVRILVGGDTMRSPAAVSDDILGCTVINDLKLLLNLTRPIANLPALLSSSFFAPHSPSFSVTDKDATGRDAEVDFARPVSGPYCLIKVLPEGRGLIFEANPLSRRIKATSPKHIIFLKTDSPRQGINLYSRDRIHITCNTTFPPELIPVVKDSADFVRADLTISSQLQPNPRHAAALSSIDVRKAISLAIDRREIAAMLNHIVCPIWRYTDLWSPQECSLPDYDPNKARQLWRNIRINLPDEISVIYADFPPNSQVVKRVAEQVKDVLNFKLIPKAVSYSEYIQCVMSESFQLLYTLTPATYDEPDSMLAPFLRDGVLARQSQYQDEGFDEMLSQAQAIFDPDLRREAYIQANNYLLEKMPVIPLFRGQSNLLRKKYLQGFSIANNGRIAFEEITITNR